MIYLLDTSGLVRLLADPAIQAAWEQAIVAQTVGSCYVQRSEFLYSARDAQEFDQLCEMFADLYPDVSVPKQASKWINAAQYRMSRQGQHRSASADDLIIAATAAHHGLTVLHDDNDFRTLAKHATDLTEHNIRDY
ncbi:PIN domain-containing protein [Nocardia sp. CA-128927]|uniref:PIN domain-containing protein n=1 Tax=Nocardia sp. CA-128927 TaxID=3239975 RepID=UPI003D9891D4